MTNIDAKKIKQNLKYHDMRSAVISHIILEGVDGVGKSSLVKPILELSDRRYIVYDRGEMSNFVYAKLYNRPQILLQRTLPFIYVLLYCDEDELVNRITRRETDPSNLAIELSKTKQQKLFLEAYKSFKQDYHCIKLDTTRLTIDQTAAKIVRLVDEYCNSLPIDDELSSWNEQYSLSCKKARMRFEVRRNQPYLNNQLMMSESTLQNGRYETFSDKSFADNLLYSLSYSAAQTLKSDEIDISSKTIDFAYIINSKLNRRLEVIDYYAAILPTCRCLVSSFVDDLLYPVGNLVRMEPSFGDEFISNLSRCKATVYCGRDLEYLKLQTARLYEAILANQIVFVDKLSDTDNEILTNIYGDNSKLADLLYVEPDTIVERYNTIIRDKRLHLDILQRQRKWYHNLIRKTFEVMA